MLYVYQYTLHITRNSETSLRCQNSHDRCHCPSFALNSPPTKLFLAPYTLAHSLLSPIQNKSLKSVLWEAKAGSSLEFETSLSNMAKPHLYKNTKFNWAWWHTPVVPATREDEGGGSLEPGMRIITLTYLLYFMAVVPGPGMTPCTQLHQEGFTIETECKNSQHGLWYFVTATLENRYTYFLRIQLESTLQLIHIIHILHGLLTVSFLPFLFLPLSPTLTLPDPPQIPMAEKPCRMRAHPEADSRDFPQDPRDPKCPETLSGDL
ncbi:hypothetical protein AAY473_027673 [Plecturocebus cupreus]